jgi:hypothetical protein
MGILSQISELSRKRRRAMRARSRSKNRGQGQQDGELTEYRGPESYEQQSPEGRGGQSGMFNQTDYPPRRIGGAEVPAEDDGQLVTLEDRLSTAPPGAEGEPNEQQNETTGQRAPVRI